MHMHICWRPQALELTDLYMICVCPHPYEQCQLDFRPLQVIFLL